MGWFIPRILRLCKEKIWAEIKKKWVSKKWRIYLRLSLEFPLNLSRTYQFCWYYTIILVWKTWWSALTGCLYEKQGQNKNPDGIIFIQPSYKKLGEAIFVQLAQRACAMYTFFNQNKIHKSKEPQIDKKVGDWEVQ